VKIIRIISLLVAILMLSSCVISCDTQKPNEQDSDSAGNSVSGTPDPDESASKLPDLTWNGETFHILGRDGGTDYATIFHNFEIARDEYPEDVVGQAIYSRNHQLEQKYGFKVTQQLERNVPEVAQVALESGDDLYDMIIYPSHLIQAHAQSGYFLDLNSELEYVNLNHPSWNSYANEQLTIAGRLYYTTNDFLLHDKHRTQFIFYNRDLAEDLKLGYFEDMVDNNTWTLENVEKIVKSVYADIDNIPGVSQTDRFGLGMENFTNFAALLFSAGFRVTEMNNEGLPQLVGATDKMLNIIDRTLDITGDSSSTYIMEANNYYGANPAHMFLFNYFLDGNILMLTEFTSLYDEWLYQAEMSIGALPNPKYDSDQERYNTYAVGSLFAIPYTVFDTEMTGFCLEALTEASTDTTYKTYIETKCKYQDAYDKDCARMLDLCFDGVVYDVGAFCDFGELYSKVTYDLQKMKVNLYKRLYDQNRKAAQSAIDQLVEAYKDN